MPLIIEPIKQIQQIEQTQIQPAIQKVENSSVTSWETTFVILVMIIIYIFRAPLLALFFFVIKFILLVALGYSTYILFIQ